jgi:iron(III) transport system substrate-binding protein
VNDALTSQIDGFDQVKGKLVPTSGTAWVVSWNTDKVDESEIPTDFWDFADPIWAGRLSMTDADWPLYMTLSQRYVAEGHTQDEVDELFRTLASYSTIVSGHTLQAQLLAAGEFDVALTTFDSGVDRIAATGAPITWKGEKGTVVQPVVVQLEGSVPVINAPNPAGALLWLDFELQQGQEVLASDHVYPVIPTSAGDKFGGVTTAFVDFDAYLNQRETWESAYREFLKQGTRSDG